MTAERGALDRILDRETLRSTLEEQRRLGQTIVFTNGCFDILHIGHARYLADARALGDVLVVGLNSDRSVRALKGPTRPLVPEEERAEMLAHLRAVDYVCIFDEDRADTLIEAVRPDIYVKGGDYTIDQVPETPTVARLGGKTVIVPLVRDRSTTRIIERVLETNS